MSGPVSATDAPPAVADCGHPGAPCVKVTDSRDEQVIKPGQLNLMTSGGAVSHAEEATGQYRGATPNREATS